MGVKRGAVRAPVAVNFPFRRARFWLQRHQWQSHSLSFRGIEKGDRWRGTFCSFILPRGSGEGGPSEREAIGWWKGAGLVEFSFDESAAASQKPPPPRFAWSPSPAIAGAEERESRSRAALSVRAPSFAKAIHETGLHKEGGRAPEGASSTAAPHSRTLPSANAAGAARATNDSLARTIRLRARSPFGAPPRLSSQGEPCTTRSRPRFAR